MRAQSHVMRFLVDPGLYVLKIHHQPFCLSKENWILRLPNPRHPNPNVNMYHSVIPFFSNKILFLRKWTLKQPSAKSIEKTINDVFYIYSSQQRSLSFGNCHSFSLINLIYPLLVLLIICIIYDCSFLSHFLPSST